MGKRGRLVALLLFMAPPAAAAAADGLVVKESTFGVIETVDRLEGVLAENGVRVFARIDHREGALRIGDDLPETELLLFGNPKLGTPLMQSARTIGVDLPMKALVWEDAEGKVWLGYNDPEWLVARHGIADRPEVVKLMTGALDAMTDAATK